MLQNAYFLAKIGADTAENERHFAENLPKLGNYPNWQLGALLANRRREAHLGGGRKEGAGRKGANFTGLVLGSIEADFCNQIFLGIRIYLKRRLRKRGSSRQDLHDALRCPALNLNSFGKQLSKKYLSLPEFC